MNNNHGSKPAQLSRRVLLNLRTTCNKFLVAVPRAVLAALYPATTKPINPISHGRGDRSEERLLGGRPPIGIDSDGVSTPAKSATFAATEMGTRSLPPGWLARLHLVKTTAARPGVRQTGSGN